MGQLSFVGLSPEEEALSQLFHPNYSARIIELFEKKRRLVHYTTAEAAISMLRTRHFWMRKASCMNDFSEVQHGIDCLVKAYIGKSGDRFKEVVDGIFDGVSASTAALFDRYIRALPYDTYIACFSEHLDVEDSFGRLSMWRAYGRDAGVAIVINPAVFYGKSDALKAYSSPVAYLRDEDFAAEFERVTENIANNADLVRSRGLDELQTRLFNTFLFATLCTKHPGFQEEREWRVVHAPQIHPSKRLVKSVETVRGIPQPVYKIPLQNIPDEGLMGIEIPQLVDRIIIGPTSYGTAMQEAFLDLLAQAGVTDTTNRVIVSDIPLR
jgi:hypothetical protein